MISNRLLFNHRPDARSIIIYREISTARELEKKKLIEWHIYYVFVLNLFYLNKTKYILSFMDSR